MNPESKPYSNRSSRLALAERACRLPVPAKVVGSRYPNLHDLWFEPLKGQGKRPKVSIVVDGRSSVCPDADMIWFFASNLAQVNSYPDLELVIACDQGAEGTAELDAYDVKVPLVGHEAHTKALTMAAQSSTGDILVFMDIMSIFETPEPIEQLVGMLSLEGVGIVSPLILYMDMSVRAYGLSVGPYGVFPLNEGHDRNNVGYLCCMRAFLNASALPLECIALQKEDFQALGGFPQEMGDYLSVASLCMSIRKKGKRCVAMPTVECVLEYNAPHDVRGRFASYANSLPYSKDQLDIFDNEWREARMAGDPYYNRLLDQRSGYYELPKHRGL